MAQWVKGLVLSLQWLGLLLWQGFDPGPRHFHMPGARKKKEKKKKRLPSNKEGADVILHEKISLVNLKPEQMS